MARKRKGARSSRASGRGTRGAQSRGGLSGGRPLNLTGFPVSEPGPGGAMYKVQRVGPSQNVYVCPGCLRDVGPGTSHVVAWPEEGSFGTEVGVTARRHWHSECWRRKLRPV